MVQANSLVLYDGTSQGRSWLKSQVYRLQAALVQAGLKLSVDGQFGKGTTTALAQWHTAKNINEPGYAGPLTMASLAPALSAAFGAQDQLIRSQLLGFRGDLKFIELYEGFIGKPYWPKGQSGVTLDPGFDLGYIEPQSLTDLYGNKIQGAQWKALQKVLGLKGQAAGDALAADPVLQGIRISQSQAEDIMPFAAKPYWKQISQRFSILSQSEALPTVQTALLSLAYNRGPGNSGLDVLIQPLSSQNWAEVANQISAMQQDHVLPGISKRRRDEASLIRWELGIETA